MASPSKSSSLGPAINRFMEQHWLATFNTGWGLFVTLPWLAPVLMWSGLTGLGRALYFVYGFFCHQLPERSWFLFGEQLSYSQLQIAESWGRALPEISNELVRRQFIGTAELGWKVAWSDRMIAMYTAIFLFGLLYAVLREIHLKVLPMPWWLFLLCIVPLGLDGTTHMINDVFRLDFRQTNDWAVALTGGIFPADFYRNDGLLSLNSWLRLLTGLIFGFGVVGFLWPLMEQEFGPKAHPTDKF
jgi:uncharacterized membrane protein